VVRAGGVIGLDDCVGGSVPVEVDWDGVTPEGCAARCLELPHATVSADTATNAVTGKA
jgi:hypothetical protein